MSSGSPGLFPFPVFGPPAPECPADPIAESFDGDDSSPLRAAADAEDGEPSMVEVRQRIAQVEKEAYEKAFLLGEKAGRELGETAAAPLIDKLGRYLEEISGLREKLLREAERELVELAFQAARAVVAAEVDARPDAVAENVRKAIAKISGEGRITLRVHPADAAAVFRSREALAPFLEGRGELRVEPDESIDRGGCLASTDYAEADATIAGQFAVLREQLAKAREERG